MSEDRACFYWVREIKFASGLREASPEQGVWPSAVLLGNAVSNLMTQG